MHSPFPSPDTRSIRRPDVQLAQVSASDFDADSVMNAKAAVQGRLHLARVINPRLVHYSPCYACGVDNICTQAHAYYTHVCMYACMYVCMYIRMYIHMYVCVCICM